MSMLFIGLIVVAVALVAGAVWAVKHQAAAQKVADNVAAAEKKVGG